MQDTVVDVTSEAFAARLAALLRAARTDQGRPLRALARSSRGSFSARTLRALESGQADLRGLQLPALASLYRLDLAALLQERVPLTADLSGGVIATAGLVRTFTPGDRDGLLLAYLHLVRDLRDLQAAPSLALRRDDVEVLATSLRSEAVAVLDRLGQLMGSTVTQRRSAVAMFAAGAALVVLSTGAVAVETGLYQPAGDPEPGSVVTVTASASMDDDEDIQEPLDGLGTLLPRPGADRRLPATGTTPGGSDAGPVPFDQASPPAPTVGPAPAPTAAAVSAGADTPTTSPVTPADGPEVRSPSGTPGPESQAPSPPSDDVPGLDVPAVDAPPGDVPPVDAPPVDPPPLVEEADAPGSPDDASEGDGSTGPGSDATDGTGDEAPGDPTDEVDPGDGPDPADDDADGSAGGSPGNSQGAGNSSDVGQPGNSGNTNAGGGNPDAGGGNPNAGGEHGEGSGGSAEQDEPGMGPDPDPEVDLEPDAGGEGSAGGSPGNSQGAGNSSDVGQPGNSGNANAGGGAPDAGGGNPNAGGGRGR
jgi:hypothetical protein